MFYKKIIILFSLCLIGTSSYAKDLSVVTTIKPVHALVSSVMQDVGTPELIIDGANSPHGFRLKPSHMRALNNADHVFYIHPNVEGFLSRVISKENDKFQELAAIEGLKRYDLRTEGHWDNCEDHHDHHDDEETLEEISHDPHIWLSHYNAKMMLDYIAQTLSKSDPDHAEIYKKNAEDYKKRIDNIDFSDLKKHEKKNFIVFHDAYQYFEKEHHLSGAGAITLDPQLPAKPKKLSELRQRIKDIDVKCIFKEPQFSNKLIDIVINDSSVHIGVLDPLGGNLTAGSDLYIQLLEDMKNSFKSCFETVGSH